MLIVLSICLLLETGIIVFLGCKLCRKSQTADVIYRASKPILDFALRRADMDLAALAAVQAWRGAEYLAQEKRDELINALSQLWSLKAESEIDVDQNGNAD